MKHYADNKNKEPRYAAKANAGGKRYAKEAKPGISLPKLSFFGNKAAGRHGAQQEEPAAEHYVERHAAKPAQEPAERLEEQGEKSTRQKPKKITRKPIERPAAKAEEPAARHAAPEAKAGEHAAKHEAPAEDKPAAPKRTAPTFDDGVVDIMSSSSSSLADGKTRVFPLRSKESSPTEFHYRRPRTDCPATPTAPVPAMKAGYAPAFLFGAFVVVMALWFIFAPKAGYSPTEKRVLSKFPKTTTETVFSGQFGKEFETYFADHFPMRNLWVGADSYLTLAEGNNGANGVYKGGDGYLINKPVSQENQIVNNLRMLSDFKQEVGDVSMTVMFVPSTGYVCSDKLPLVHETYHDDEYFDYANAWMTEFGIKFLDLREPIKKAYRSGTQVYYKTDHHWTTAGAYVAYREYCKNFGLVTKPEEGFEVERLKKFYGTTYAKSGLWFTQPDTIELWKNPNNEEQDIHVEITDGGKVVKSQNSMYFYSHATEDDKYPVFLDGNHEKTVITNQNASKGTVLVIKDSFSHCFAPFLSESFSKVVMVDMRYNTQDITQLVRNEKPEQILVLYGMDNFLEDTDLGHLWG